MGKTTTTTSATPTTSVASTPSLTPQEHALIEIRTVPAFTAEAARKRRQRSPETEIGRKRRVRKINTILGQTYPYAVAELDFENPFQLLVATVLSAQTTDVRVNSVTPTLFTAYPDAAALASARAEDLEDIIKSLGFYRAKTRSIIALAQQLVTECDGQVPATLKQLVKLAGVGRKTAFVVLGNAFNQPGLTVDTHFGRLARRMGMTIEKDPVKVEREVAALFEKKDWTQLSHRLVYHGRRICHAQKPACGVCPVADLCPSYGEGETDEIKARKLMKYEMAPGREGLHLKFLKGYSRRQLQAEGYSLGS
ncbi:MULTISPECIES: endonuclease III [unclassified Rothia (in: high G+C Gram-positive bacteria)]|uniref:endonuclease III n=1 Tax=unclassified Rothia (in: high G+C Gram-positive bacteria) TaxID=2689056 RepID=UPI00195618C0|nr:MULTISPECIES: endonuclease III [unclassified Rothia (in: high G+C Gram-positive bacteria)]MBM7051974.1 endonuclease III [Rothia sp. ZJ1223]QRZ61963.1 endonuclease III [Rothia sp. ZJ932]